MCELITIIKKKKERVKKRKLIALRTEELKNGSEDRRKESCVCVCVCVCVFEREIENFSCTNLVVRPATADWRLMLGSASDWPGENNNNQKK